MNRFQSCPGITVILLLDDEVEKAKVQASASPTLNKLSASGANRGQSAGGRKRLPSPRRGRKRSLSPESGIFRDVHIGPNSAGAAAPPGEGTGIGTPCGGRGGRNGSAGVMLPPKASNPPMVDLSVVDYVLKKPFSDESLRRLLEAVEADHLQVCRWGASPVGGSGTGGTGVITEKMKTHLSVYQI